MSKGRLEIESVTLRVGVFLMALTWPNAVPMLIKVQNSSKLFVQANICTSSFVYLIKGPRVRKTAVPDLIHHLGSLNIVLTIRSLRDRNRCPTSDTFLVLISKFPLTPMPELPPKSTLAAQGRGSDLSAGSMP